MTHAHKRKSRLVSKVLFLFILLLFILALDSRESSQTFLRSFKTPDGRERAHILHTPPGFSFLKPRRPLVLVFHGGGRNAQIAIEKTEFNDEADKHGFIVVYPNGTGVNDEQLTWNAGVCCGNAVKESVDDTNFVKLILEELKGEFNVDPTRIYAVGFSNGGQLAYKLACELPSEIAAVAPVSGNLKVSSCDPKRRVPIIAFEEAEEDQYLKILDQPDRNHQGGRKGVGNSEYGKTWGWVEWNGCNVYASSQVISPLNDKNEIIKETYPGCLDKADIVVYRFIGADHDWPVGLVGGEEAVSVIWRFFRKHPMASSI